MRYFCKCREVTHLCDKHQYGEISAVELWKIKFHYLLCKDCRTYSRKNKVLSHAIENIQLKSLPSEAKRELKNKISSELNAGKT